MMAPVTPVWLINTDFSGTHLYLTVMAGNQVIGSFSSSDEFAEYIDQLDGFCRSLRGMHDDIVQREVQIRYANKRRRIAEELDNS